MKPPDSDLPRPEDYPLGSPESRAAARASLKRRAEDDEIVFYIRVTDRGIIEENYALASGKKIRRRGHELSNDDIVWDTPLEGKLPTRIAEEAIIIHFNGWPIRDADRPAEAASELAPSRDLAVDGSSTKQLSSPQRQAVTDPAPPLTPEQRLRQRYPWHD